MAYKCTKSDVGVWMADESRCESVSRMIAIDAMIALGFNPDDFRKRDEIIVAIAKRVDGVLDYVATNVAPPHKWTAEDVSDEQFVAWCKLWCREFNSHGMPVRAMSDACNIMRVPKPQPVAVDVLAGADLSVVPLMIATLIGRCEINETKFDNDDMSAALAWGEHLRQNMLKFSQPAVDVERLAVAIVDDLYKSFAPSGSGSSVDRGKKFDTEIAADTLRRELSQATAEGSGGGA